MSMRSRARNLQRATGMTYQQALDRLRALGAAPAEMARRTGRSLADCDRALVQGLPPIEVVELPAAHRFTVDDDVRSRALAAAAQVCEELLASACARAVVLFDGDGRMIVHVGERDLIGIALFASRRPAGLRAVSSELVEAMGGGKVHVESIARHGSLIVRFDGSTSLGLVRLRARKAAEELARILDEDSGGFVPRGGSGSGGAPAEAGESVEIFRRKKPG